MVLMIAKKLWQPMSGATVASLVAAPVDAKNGRLPSGFRWTCYSLMHGMASRIAPTATSRCTGWPHGWLPRLPRGPPCLSMCSKSRPCRRLESLPSRGSSRWSRLRGGTEPIDQTGARIARCLVICVGSMFQLNQAEEPSLSRFPSAIREIEQCNSVPCEP